MKRFTPHHISQSFHRKKMLSPQFSKKCGVGFTHVNEGFVCAVCGAENPAAQATCRNHCRICLHSKHVDKNPGDRAQSCGGILVPVSVEIRAGEMQSIIFHCQKCGMVRKNKIASDDNREKLLEIFEKGTKLW